MNLKPFLAAAIVAATPFAASAATLIDDFTVGQGPVIDITPGGDEDFESSGDSNGDGMYDWDTRQIRANLLSAVDECGTINCPEVRAGIESGSFVYDSSQGTESWVELRYGYDEGYDLTNTGNSFEFAFGGVGTDQAYSLRILLTDGDNESYEWFIKDGTESEFTVMFSDIVGEDLTDLTDITRIDFRFSSENVDTEALDLRISSITTPIPLPAGVLMMGTALAGFGVMRRRQKKAAA